MKPTIPKPIVVVPPDMQESVPELAGAGYCVIIGDASKVRIISLGGQIECGDALMAAMHALVCCEYHTANKLFINELYRRMKERETQP